MAAVNISPLFNGYQSFLNTGLPNNGGLINTYQAGTSNAIPAYQDSGGTTPHANPIVLDSAGRPPAEIWLNIAFAYKFVLTDSLSNTLGTFDNITGTPTLATSNTWGGTQTFTNQASFAAGLLLTGGSFVGDFTNASIPARIHFVSSVTNGVTELGLVPNGSGGQSGLSVFTDPTPTNSAFGRLSCGSASGVLLESNVLGAGTQGPLRFAVGASNEVARFSATNKQFLIGTTAESAVTTVKIRVSGGLVEVNNSCAVAVHRNGVNQVNVATATFTKVQLTTIRTDQNGNFDNVTNYRWTPPAGTYYINANAGFTNLSAAARTASIIYKNGVALFSTNSSGTIGQANGAPAGGIDVANGTDYYELFCWHNSGANETLSGLVQDTFMTGNKVG